MDYLQKKGSKERKPYITHFLLCIYFGQSLESCLLIYGELYAPLGAGADGNHSIAALWGDLPTSRDVEAEVALSPESLHLSTKEDITKGQMGTKRDQKMKHNFNCLIGWRCFHLSQDKQKLCCFCFYLVSAEENSITSFNLYRNQQGYHDILLEYTLESLTSHSSVNWTN